EVREAGGYKGKFQAGKLDSETHFGLPATTSRPAPTSGFGWQWGGDRSLSPLIRSSRTESIAGLMSDDQITTRESVASSSQDRCATFLHSAPSFEIILKHACNIGANRTARSHAAFGVHSAIHQHRRPMDSRLADHVLRSRRPLLGLDQRVRNDRTLGILPDARSQGPAEFQNHRNDLWSGDACW